MKPRIHSDNLRGHGSLGGIDETLSAQFISADGQVLIDVSDRLPVNHSKSDRFIETSIMLKHTETGSEAYLQASLYPLMTEVGWIFCLTSSSALFSSSAAMITYTHTHTETHTHRDEWFSL